MSNQLEATDFPSSSPRGRVRPREDGPRGQASEQGERYDRQRLPLAMRLARKLRFPVNRFLASQSRVGTAPFFEPSDIPGIRALSENWEAIRDEAAAVLADRARVPALGKVSPDHRGIAPTSSWKSFFFTGYGYQAKANRARCPKTAALLDSIPDLVVGFYSIFEPGTHVKAHKGVTSGLINIHLPLSVPARDLGRCELRVEQDYRSWTPGHLLVFDETYEHEAWNQTSEPRLVLLIQVLRPMHLPGRMIGRFFLWCIKRTSFVQDIRRNIGAE
ncbi:aspartyl/asparaginyl beta-hydroxylase domain-containing protein [Novosphingobium sp. JCM 18896]|uniref:aspartyl/asparaginyl beta-hydroxylase domain-containing protein n=1 Tax=Novosphingobium sp. JCM 18896 TaxID=2989731 RepID=UPI0022215651|nr:aspartyl/asparaginyl beta-hydroxylase domain-containing protein [Novosphingobium sp. JCM 18896]MCW1430253.1 aspartyl/asparaginyl beta-hydroxylase domain-containing protein [Novosphingobium sp. JCM 18896]